LVVDASLQGDWSGLIGNPVKFFLSQITMVFDVWFLVQHYVLYRRSMEEVEVEEEERRMLIGSER
jgi:cystinosin